MAQRFFALSILLFSSLSFTIDNHAPVAASDKKEAYILDLKRWSAHYPDVWSIDSTSIPKENYVPLFDALSREFNLKHRRVKGGNIWYKISLENLPKEYAKGTCVIETEFPMPVAKIFASDKELADITRGTTGLYRRNASTGRNFIIENAEAAKNLYICVKDFDFLFANHIGKVIIRKPELTDRVYIKRRIVDKPGKFEILCNIRNRFNSTLQGKFKADIMNYFGKVLRTESFDIDLKPEKNSKWIKIEKKSPEDYKLIARFIDSDGASTPEHWTWFRDSELSKNQSQLREYEVLDWGWEAHWVKEADGFKMPLPVNGWTSNFPRKKYPFDGVSPGLPLFWKEKNIPTHRMWVKCNFKTQTDLKEKRVKLFLRSIAYEGVFYVNGKFVKKLHNHDLPAYLDITDFLNADGNNELAIGITDYTAIRAADAPKLKDGQHGGGHVVDSGPFLIRDVNIGLKRSPVLITEPDVFVKNVKIDTVFEPQKTISATSLLKNESASQKDISVRQAVFADGKEVLEMGSLDKSVSPGKTAEFSFTKKWADAEEWNFNNPKLYELRTEIKVNGKFIDRFSERFGFKEWAMKGRDFYLNGQKVHPFGDGYGTNNYQYYWPVIPTYSRISRIGIGGKKEHWLDVADEAGHAGTWEINMSPFGGMGYRLGEDILYKNLLSKWKKIIPEDRNHPSLFCYTLGNEPPTSDEKICQKMFLHEKEIYKLDPSKLAHFSRGNELMGKSEMYSPHYLYHKHLLPMDLNYFASGKASEYAMDRLKTEHGIGHQYETTWLFWDKDKPIFDSEGASVTDGKEYVPWLFGEAALIRRPDDVKRYPRGVQIVQDVMRAYLYEGHRRNGLSSLLAHIGWRWGDESLSPIAAFFYEDEIRLFSNKSNKRTICVLNDTMQDDEIDVKIKIENIDGTPRGKFTKKFNVPCGGLEKWELDLPGFECSQPEYVNVTLTAEGLKTKYFYRKQIRMTIYPPFNSKGLKLEKVILYDPSGKDAKELQKSGFKLKTLPKIDDESLNDTEVLIVGRNAAKGLEKISGLINKKVKNGMRVLFLRQKTVSYPFPFKVEDGDNFSDGVGAVIAAPMSKVFDGLLPEDMRFWQNADRVPLLFRNAPFIPRSGNVLPLLAGSRTCYPQTVEYSPLFLGYYGKGAMMVSQLEIIPSLSYDPVPARLLKNILKFLMDYKKKEKNFSAILDKETMFAFKNRHGLDVNFLTFDPEKSDSLFLGPNAGDIECSSEKLKAFVERGGMLYLKGLDNKKMKMLEKVFGLKPELKERKTWEALMAVRDPLFEGLTQYNWAWEREKKSDALMLGYKTISIPSAKYEVLLQPSFIVKAPVGKGFIVMDTSNWNKANMEKAQLITVSILRNLGAKFVNREKSKASKDWKKLAAQYDFYPLDVSCATNRGFADDAAGNGKGGWTDEGKGHDIGNFPVGKQSFNEIPFLITEPDKNNGNGLVAMKGHCWSKLPSKSKEIPVKKKLDKIFFIQACAWALLPEGDDMARYVIYYADRKDWIPGKPLPYVYVPIKNKRHVYDWWFFDKIAQGKLSMPEASIAWRDKGNNKNRGASMMEWTNPYPDREIDAIEVEAISPKAQFFFIGATGAKFKKGERKTIVPVKVPKERRPQTLNDFKGKLWSLKSEKYLIYLDEAARIRWFGTLDGFQLFGKLGAWIIQKRVGKEFSHLGGQTGKLISKLNAYSDGKGFLIMELKDIDEKLLTWNQKISIGLNAVNVENSWKFKSTFIDAAKGGFCTMPTIAVIAKNALSNKGDLLGYGNGYAILPIKGYSATAHFDKLFMRHKQGMWHIEKNASLSILPSGLDMEKIDLNKTYKTDLTIDISKN